MLLDLNKSWIENCGEWAASAFIPDPNTVCVSITEGHDAELASTYDAVLRIQFIDVDDLSAIERPGLYEISGGPGNTWNSSALHVYSGESIG